MTTDSGACPLDGCGWEPDTNPPHSSDPLIYTYIDDRGAYFRWLLGRHIDGHRSEDILATIARLGEELRQANARISALTCETANEPSAAPVAPGGRQ